MKLTMEDQKQTSQYLYEDEYVFVTEENELFLKKGSEGGQKKVCDISEDQIDKKNN